MADKKPLIYEPRVQEPSVPSPVIQPPVIAQLPQIYDPNIIGPYKPEKSSYVNPNDTYEINSVADIILGTFDQNMNRPDWEIGGVNLSDIPIVNIIPSTFQYVKDAYVTPISRGDWGAVGINTLNNFSETMDVLADPIKGLILEGTEGFKNALGLNNTGRYHYNFDTGNPITDMICEVAVDPLNWITFFGKGAVSSILKRSVSKNVAQIGAETGEDIAQEVYESIAKSVTKSLMKNSDEPIGVVAQEAARTLLNNPIAPAEFTEAFVKNLGQLQLDSTTGEVIKTLNGVVKGANTVQSVINKAAIGVPYAAGYLVKKTGSALWDLIHSDFIRGLKNMKTPSGNVDVLQIERIEKYTQHTTSTYQEIYDMVEDANDQVGKDVFHTTMQEALLKETDNITHYMKNELKDMADVNLEGKVKLLRKYILEHTNMDAEVYLNALQDISNEHNNKYDWIYDWVRSNLDMDKAVQLDARKATWDMIHDLQGKIKDLKDTKSIDSLQRFEQYLKDKYNLSVPDFLEQTKTYDITLGEDFAWLGDRFNIDIKNLATGPIYDTKYKIKQKLYELLTEPKELEAETRYQAIDNFIMGEHDMHVPDYLQVLKENAARYPGIFDDYIKELEDNLNKLNLVDDLSQRYAIKEAVTETVEQANTLLKEQKEALDIFPKKVDMQMNAFVQNYLLQSDPALSLKGLALNPAIFEKYILEGDFTPEEVKKYIGEIRARFQVVVDKMMSSLEDKNLMTNKAYVDIVKQIRQVYEQSWKPIAKILRKQILEHADGFYDLDDVFKDLPQKLNNIIEQNSPLLQEYHQALNKADVLNHTENYENLISKNPKEYEEAYEKLITATRGVSEKLITVEPDRRLQRLQDMIIRLNSEDLSDVDSDKINETYAKILAFFNGEVNLDDAALDYWPEPNKIMSFPELVPTWLHNLKEATQTVEKQVKTGLPKVIPHIKKDVPKEGFDLMTYLERPLKSGTPETGLHITRYEVKQPLKIPKIWEDAFINNFQDFFAAVESKDVANAIGAAQIIYNNLTALAWTSTDVREVLEPLIDVFSVYNNYSVKHKLYDITGAGVWYHMKLEQDYVLMTMMADKEVNAFMKELLTPDLPLGNMFKNLLLTGDPLAKQFMDSLTSYMNYRDFLNMLYKFIGNPKGPELPIDHDVLGAFTSTLQKYAMRNPQKLIANFKGNFYHIMRQTEEQINTMEMPCHLNLDDLAAKLEQDPKYAELLKDLEAHHALDDAIRTWAISDANLSEEFKKLFGENAVGIQFDIETNGLNGEVNQITEMGLYNPEFNLKQEYILQEIDPGLKRAHPAKTQRVVNTASEFEAFKAFFETLEDIRLKAKGRVVYINMHNGFKFDRPFFINRLQALYQNAKLEGNADNMKLCANMIAQLKSGKYKFSDSLKMLQEKANYTVIPEETRLNLYYTLREFAYKQKDKEKFIQPLDPTIAKQLKEIADELRESAGDAAFADYEEYYKHVSAIYDLFNQIKTANKDLSRTLLKKEIFADELFQQYYGVFNITQALNTKNGEIIDGIKRYGVKKHLDSEAIMEYFKGTTLTESQMLFRTNVARDIDNIYSLIRNTNRLKYYDKHMRQILQIFLDRALGSAYVPTDLSDLKVHPDYKANYAILRKLYKWKSSKFKNIPVSQTKLKTGEIHTNYADNILDGLCSDIISPEFRLILEDISLVKTRTYIDDGSLSADVDTERQAIWHQLETERQQRYLDEHAEEFKKRAEELEAKKTAALEAKKEYIDRKYQEYMNRMADIEAATERTIEYKIDTVVEFEKKLNLNAKLADYQGYYDTALSVFHDYQDLMDILENLGKGWDKTGAQRAVVQVRSTSLKETSEMWKAVLKRHNQINDVNTQFKQIVKYREIPDALARQMMDITLNLSDDDLYAHLVNGARRVVAMDMTELSPDQIKNILNKMKDREAKHIITVFAENQIFFVLDNTVKLSTHTTETGLVKHLANGVYVAPPRLPALNVPAVLDEILNETEDVEIKKHIAAIYDKFYNLIGDYDTGYSPHYGSMGELTTKAFYTGAPASDKYEENIGFYGALPDEVKKLLPVPEEMYDNQFFHGGSFNFSVLGGGGYRRKYNRFANYDIVSMLTSTMTQQITHLKSYMEYMNMFFDNTFSIQNGEIAKFSDEALLSALQNSPEYRLVTLVKDAKRGAKVVDLNPQTISDIKKARELNAVIMSGQTYSTAYGAINTFGMRHDKLNMLHKINYLYKAGYILSPGTMLRNIVDSVMKNYVAASDDPTGMTQAFLTAWQIYWKYRKTAKQLIDYCYDTATGTSSITEELSEQFFKANVSPLTKELYEFAHGFYTDGPSGGEIKELAKYFMHDKKLSPYGITTQILNFLMQPNEVVEQVCRFAEYIWALGQDMSSTKAYALIAKTHFDYAIKTDTQRLLELVFPFYTFTVNNIHYWLEAFDKFPALLSLLRDVFTPIWNLDDYTPQELKYNKSTEYRILSGNLPLDKFFGSSAANMVLKLNPSFMDTLQLATDPINTIKGKLQPTLQTALNYAGAGLPEEMKYAYGINTPSVSSPAEAMQAITELLPIAGPIINRYFRQGPVYYERTQNPLTSILPDIFGATAALKTYTPKVSSYKSYKKRIPKPKKIYVHNIYPKKIYSSVGYSIDNFYNRLYNKYTGKSRIASMTRPVTGQTLKYRLKDLYYYYKW